MEKAKQEIIKFTNERDWGQYHTPENLAKSIAIEASELLECFQWSNEFNKQDVCDELADVVNYCIQLANVLDVDMETIVLNKLEETKKKYPIEECLNVTNK